MRPLVEAVIADPAGSPPTHDGWSGRATSTETILAEVLAGVLGREHIPVDAHFFDDLGADSLLMAQFCARVRKHPDLPSVSMKDVYQNSTITTLATAIMKDSSATTSRRAFAEVLAGVLGREHIPVDAHFFDDLGADSLLMAQFCARVRKHPDLPSVSMKDVYRNPTIRRLSSGPAVGGQSPGPRTATPQAATPQEPPTEPATPVSTAEYVLCGCLQLLFFLAYCGLAGFGLVEGYKWINDASGVLDTYLRSLGVGLVVLLGACTLPIVAKWVLIGRWTAGSQIRVWTLSYVRFWLVKTLVRANPANLLFVGTPLYSMYLRAMGATIGPRTAIFSRNVVCTDLLTVGANTVIRRDAYFLCYRAHAGWIQTGPVRIGRDAFVGERTVLDIDTAIGDGAQLGHTSALTRGMSVPDGERWHGSPAQRTDTNYLRVAPARCGRLRRIGFSLITLIMVVAVYLPLVEGGITILRSVMPSLATLPAEGTHRLDAWQFYAEALALSAALFICGVLIGLVTVFVLPRVLNLFITPGKIYPLYGFHYSVHRTIDRLTNNKFFTYLFGDTSYIVHYLQAVGYNLSRVEQTGSNFGMEVRHENPYLSRVGSGTMVADGLSFMNADFSSTSFKVSPVRIGARNFLGNHVAYPPDGRTGDNVLIATKAMVPLDGNTREGVGLLGSPSFEIPRTVLRDTHFDHLRTGDELRRSLAAKNRYDLRTMALFAVGRWFHIALLTVLGLAAIDLYDTFSSFAMGAYLVVGTLVSTTYFVLAERAFTVSPLRPQYCSIYDPYFWWHERLWKFSAGTYMHLFDGTPVKSLVWRALGVRVGRRVFDDGCGITERTLTTIGDGAVLNAASTLQCHSQEDGAFKSDRTTVGAGSTLGVGAFVHYGVTIGDGAFLAPDSFLMKGEEIPPRARWGGNPAREI